MQGEPSSSSGGNGHGVGSGRKKKKAKTSATRAIEREKVRLDRKLKRITKLSRLLRGLVTQILEEWNFTNREYVKCRMNEIECWFLQKQDE